MDECVQTIINRVQEWAKPTAKWVSDTRQLNVGDVFLAYVVGNERQRVDMRPWILKALQCGAACVLCEVDTPEDVAVLTQWKADSLWDTQIIPVKDLAILAGVLTDVWCHTPSQKMKMIGITGTNGKTTISQWLAHVLSTEAPQRCGIVGTLGVGFPNNLKATGFTTPDAVQLHHILAALTQQGAQSVAMEVSSHALDQGRVNGVRFHTAVLTNLTQDHLDYHGTLDAYALAKRRLLTWTGLRYAVVNANDAMGLACLKADDIQAQRIAFGMNTTSVDQTLATLMSDSSLSIVWAKTVLATPHGLDVELWVRWQGVEYEFKAQWAILGLFNLSNVLAVFAVVLAQEWSLDQIMIKLADLPSVPGRMQALGGQDQPLVVVDYAHTPDALEKTLSALRPITTARQGRLWCVMGCGGNRDTGKRPLMGAVAEQYADYVMITSDNPRYENPFDIIYDIKLGLKHPEIVKIESDRAQAIEKVIIEAGLSDVVLLAGKGHETTQEIAGIKKSFSDVAQAQQALVKRGYERE